MPKRFVLSVGGSLMVGPQGIDIKFLRDFRNFILKQTRSDGKFYLVVGGGTTARTYIQSALAVRTVNNHDRDWVGIRATRLNAQLLKVVLGDQAYPTIVTNPTKPIKTNKKIIIVAGYKPGWSTDHVAVLLAKHNHVSQIINLSNIDYAYDKDPRKFSDAKKLTKISWPEFRQIVGNRWQPGLNVPFDPIASREAQKNKMSVIILNGRKLSNLSACLAEAKFRGTSIS